MMHGGVSRGTGDETFGADVADGDRKIITVKVYGPVFWKQ
jgi:hypothetical protein